MKRKLRNLFIGLAVFLLACLGLIYSGVIGVSAGAGGGGFTDWLFRTVVTNSVESAAASVEAPDLAGGDRLRKGVKLYRSNCAGCHGSPAGAPEDFARGLHPRPPELADRVERWSPEELFWITKHGIRMTGMPAWGKILDDEAIWDLVAAMRSMPGTPASAWREMEEEDTRSPAAADPSPAEAEPEGLPVDPDEIVDDDGETEPDTE